MGGSKQLAGLGRRGACRALSAGVGCGERE